MVPAKRTCLKAVQSQICYACSVDGRVVDSGLRIVLAYQAQGIKIIVGASTITNIVVLDS